MKIYLDNIIFSLQKIGGISIYWFELIKRLNSLTEVYFINHKGYNSNLLYSSFNFIYNKAAKTEFFFYSLVRFFPFLSRLPTGSIFHSSYQRFSLQRDIINILTIHDLGYELNLMQTGLKRKVHLFFKKIAIKKADGIICVSENTKNDLLIFYPFLKTENIKVIYNGVTDIYKKSSNFENASFTNSLPKKYILFVGARFQYKNFNIAVETVKDLQGFTLIVAGGKPLTVNEKTIAEKYLPGRYCIYSKLSNSELSILYNKAFCLLYPSSYEGFGIPILEAMSCGCPCVALNSSSIPEVAGEAALLSSEATKEGFLSQIQQLHNIEIREKMIKKGLSQAKKFSWELCADLTIEFYKEIHDRKFRKHIHVD